MVSYFYLCHSFNLGSSFFCNFGHYYCQKETTVSTQCAKIIKKCNKKGHTVGKIYSKMFASFLFLYFVAFCSFLASFSAYLFRVFSIFLCHSLRIFLIFSQLKHNNILLFYSYFSIFFRIFDCMSKRERDISEQIDLGGNNNLKRRASI